MAQEFAMRRQRGTHNLTGPPSAGRATQEAARAIDWNSRMEKQERLVHELSPHEEQHFPIAHWSHRWGFSEKTVREWFRDEYGPGILRQQNVGRRGKRDYSTLMISPSAAARIYAKRTGPDLGERRTREVM